MVICQNIKVIESTIKVYGNMQVMKNHTIAYFHASHTLYHSMEEHARILSDYDSVI